MRREPILGCFCAFAMLFLGASGRAQTKPTEVVQPGDLLLVTVHDMIQRGSPTDFDVRVDDEGKISLPLVRRISVQDLSFADAAKAIAKQFEDKGYLKKAKVEVRRTDEPAEKKIKPAPIAVGETVKIRIWDLRKLGQSADFEPGIMDDGTVDLPVVGKFKLAGLTEFEAEDAVARQCATRGLLKDAMVTVRRIALAD